MIVSSNHAASLEVLDERSERLIGVLGVLPVQRDVLVVIPGIARRVVHLHHTYALFDQARCSEAATCGRAFTIQVKGSLRFLAEVEYIRRFGLHTVSRLHRSDGRFKLRRILCASDIHRIQLLDEIEFLRLLRRVEPLIMDIRDQLVRIEVLWILFASPIRKRRSPGEPPAESQRSRAAVQRSLAHSREHDESRKILILGAETVGEP